MDLQGPYREFERRDGAVDAEWIRAAQDCTGEALDELTERQRYIAAHGTNRVRLDPADGAFSPQEVVRLQDFLRHAMTEAFVAAMFNTARRTGKVAIGDPIGQGKVQGDCSIFGESVVFLRFTGGEEPFYLVQHNFAVEALYFPLRGCMVHLSDCLVPKVKLRRLFVFVHRSAAQCVRYLRSERRWGGLLVANESPFHYFYFLVPGVVITCFGQRDPLPAAHTLAAESYADVPAMFRLGPPTVVHESGAALQSAMAAASTFLFSAGLRPRIWTSPQRFRMIDDVILESCRRARATEAADLRDNHDFVLWAGVSSGKRAWREEVDAVVALATELSRRFPRVALLVDGWTSSVTRREMPAAYGGDEASYRKIRDAVPSNVTCVDLVGREPELKVALATTVDFFVCSHGTASLFVGRIARRRGLTHISNAAREAAISQHVHDHTTVVPPGLVHDRDHTEADKFRVGYSIDPSAFVRHALSILEKRNPDPS